MVNINPVKNIISYWRDSAVEADRLSVKYKETEHIWVPMAQIISGKLNPKLLEKLISKKNKNTVQSDKKESSKNPSEKTPEKPDKKFEILICPSCIVINGQLVTALWIPALIDLKGNITPGEYHPWIPRELLKPTDNEIVIGSYGELENIIIRGPRSIEDWPELWEFSQEIFLKTTGQNLLNFKLNSKESLKESLRESLKEGLVCLNTTFSANKSIIKLYDSILRSQSIPPLLHSFALLNKSPLKKPLGELESIELSSQHLGQMSDTFPLSQSQRESLHHFLNDELILAVNGPPGTGKTTFLHSIIATLVVKSALNKEEPPVIVAASNNNQAVTNIIKSLNIEANRWLPDINCYGLYCASKETSEFQTISFMEQLENDKYFIKAKEHYLQKSQEYFKKPMTLQQTTATLLGKLKALTERLKDGPLFLLEYEKAKKAIDSYGDIEKHIKSLTGKYEELRKEVVLLQSCLEHWKDFYQNRPLKTRILERLAFFTFARNCLFKENQEFIEYLNLDIDCDFSDPSSISLSFKELINKAIIKARDCRSAIEPALNACQHQNDAASKLEAWLNTHKIKEIPEIQDRLDAIRYKAFAIAMNYWEGRWLIEREDELNSNYVDRSSVLKTQKKWRRHAKITPCIVSTLYMLPKHFTAYEGKNIPLYEFIDLLIIDEAGQVSPEVAGASFSLAKKALIVGDELQIEPVWNVPRYIDNKNIEKHNLAKNFEKFHETGWSASAGSVIKVANARTPYEFNNKRGMFLTEHRRCVPEIINYCNELAYNNKLKPMRPSMEKYIFPHMGHVHIEGTSEKYLGSRRNIAEAVVISQWLTKNKELIESYYNKPLKETLAVLTPFKAQSNILKYYLELASIDITTGTIHTLQGAERDIILFSTVYDDNSEGAYFFDRSINMLNVAVSRAKDSFMVFGNKRILKPYLSRPSGILAKYIFTNK